MQLNKKIIIILTLSIICFVIDRLSKLFFINFFLENNFQSYYVNKFLNFDLIWNRGVAFGFFASDNFFYHIISFLIFLIILLIIYLAFKTVKQNEIIAFSIIAGGAGGNFFDRIYYSSVPDFIDLHYKDFHWFTFNVSDICITIGVILLLIFDIISLKTGKNEKK